MRASLGIILAVAVVMFIALIFPAVWTALNSENDLQSFGPSEWFTIEGLVENPLNLTYAELKSFPLVSEVATLQCVGQINVTYNWTGVPLFHLLNLAKVVSGGYREVVFNATDDFSSSIRLETAMDPTTILALEANGTDLEQVRGFGSGYRVVLPCMWGYKWVKWIEQITVVDYDYKGTYEHLGYPDEAIRPYCTMPLINPPLQNFSATKIVEYRIQALTNSSIEHFSFKANTWLIFNITGPTETTGYFYVIFPRDLLAKPYKIFIDRHPIMFSQADVNGRIYLYFTYNHSSHTIEIEGSPVNSICGGGRPPLLR